MKRTFLLLMAGLAVAWAGAYESAAWRADLGDGTYRNPVLYADYSDPDAIRVGHTYYLISSSFNCVPGLQILTSPDLVNWTIAAAALPHAVPGLPADGTVQHGRGVWAPSIREHEGHYYIFYGDPDQGIYRLRAPHPLGPWSEPALIVRGKGLIDPTPLWDDDGRCYLVHALAGSRAGLKSVLLVAELNREADSVVVPSRIVFDGHGSHPTCEGPKLYKRNGYYYIFTPAGGVSTGWQLVLRSREVYGPYEARVVMRQGNTAVNGPHQGAWVTDPKGGDWFLHFQDIGVLGRVVHLQPMSWKDDWPVIGQDPDGDGCGEPVSTWRKPWTAGRVEASSPQESDSLNTTHLGLQWQWHGNPSPTWHYCDAAARRLRLYSQPAKGSNLWDVPNLLLQKITGPDFTATATVSFHPSAKRLGERAGLVVMGHDYAGLVFDHDSVGQLTLSLVSCHNAHKGGSEVVHAVMPVEAGQTVHLRARVRTVEDSDLVVCAFSYSFDGTNYHLLHLALPAREGEWIGAKVGLFCTRRRTINDTGWLDLHDWEVRS